MSKRTLYSSTSQAKMLFFPVLECLLFAFLTLYFSLFAFGNEFSEEQGCKFPPCTLEGDTSSYTYYVTDDSALSDTPQTGGNLGSTVNPFTTLTRTLVLDGDIYGQVPAGGLKFIIVSTWGWVRVKTRLLINESEMYASEEIYVPGGGYAIIEEDNPISLPHTSSGDELVWEFQNVGTVNMGVAYRWPDTSPAHFTEICLEPSYTPVTITLQPFSQTANPGTTVQFRVIATGSPPITYQWKKNDISIPLAEASTLPLSNVQPSDAGTYVCDVTNPAGTVSSDAAILTVTASADDPVGTDTFESGIGEWNWSTFDDDIFNPAEGTWEQMPGTTTWALALESDDTEAQSEGLPALAYGFWLSPRETAADRIPYRPNKLYRVRWSLVSDRADAANQPGLRFRIGVGSDACGGDMVLQEFGNWKIPITTDVNVPTEIDHYWYPPQWVVDENIELYPEQTGMYVAAEMFDNRAAATGKYWIPKIEIYEMNPPASTSPVWEAPPFDISSDVWRDMTKWGDVVSSIDTNNGLTINFPPSSESEMRLHFLEFIDSTNPIPIEADTLYRLTFTAISSYDTLPVLRQRMIVRNLYIGSENVITPTVPTGFTFDYAIPGSVPREMVCYLPVGTDFIPGDDLLFSMDVYGPVATGDPYLGTYNVTDIAMESLDMP